MRIPMTLSLVLASGLAFAAACSGSTTTTEEPQATASASADMGEPEPTATQSAGPVTTATATAPMTATATATASAPPAKKGWKDMSHDEKMEFMKAEVMPKMAKTWGDFDKKYAKMDCATCHGKGAKSGKFTMPNPDLPKLDHTDNFKKHAGKQKVLDFMFKMSPELAGILGVPPFDPTTKSGFGCMSCHNMVEAKPAAGAKK